MRKSNQSRWPAAFVPALLSCVAATALAQATPGNWTDHDVRFTYMGFTSQYTCEGMRDKVRMLLRELGARPDLSVESVGCAESLEPRRLDRMPSVRLRFATLQPAPAPGQASGVWKSVQLGGPGMFGASDCELLEELARQVVPLFAVRNMENAPTCTPHQEPVRVSLRLESFRAAAP